MKEGKTGTLDVKSLLNENRWTVVLTTILVVGVALGTGSLHCLWGLVMLINLRHLTIIGVAVPKDDKK